MPAQPGPCPMQSRLDRSHWHAQDSCSLLRGQLLHMEHMENLDVERPQSINRLSKQDTGFFERAFLLRIPSPLYLLKSGSSFSLNHLIERRFVLSSTRAQSHECGVQSNTTEPGRKPRTSLKAIQMAQGIKEGSLYRVFGILAIAKDSLREPKDAIPVGHHQARKCRRITRPGARQQALFLLCH